MVGDRCSATTLPNDLKSTILKTFTFALCVHQKPLNEHTSYACVVRAGGWIVLEWTDDDQIVLCVFLI